MQKGSKHLCLPVILNKGEAVLRAGGAVLGASFGRVSFVSRIEL